MNINPESLYRTDQPLPAPPPSDANRPARPRGAGGEGPPDDSVSFSTRAEAFMSARARLESAIQPSRAERIETLAALLASGAYTADGEAVAGAMLADDLTARMLGFGPAR